MKTEAPSLLRDAVTLATFPPSYLSNTSTPPFQGSRPKGGVVIVPLSSINKQRSTTNTFPRQQRWPFSLRLRRPNEHPFKVLPHLHESMSLALAFADVYNLGEISGSVVEFVCGDTSVADAF
jgi:hypothetical protein